MSIMITDHEDPESFQIRSESIAPIRARCSGGDSGPREEGLCVSQCFAEEFPAVGSNGETGFLTSLIHLFPTMAFHLIHRSGTITPGKSESDFLGLIDELDTQTGDIEVSSVAVVYKSTWCISVMRGGYVVLENLKAGGARHIPALQGPKILDLWADLVHGNIASLESEPWLPGIDSGELRKLSDTWAALLGAPQSP